ncbi:MAG: hypothetical protein VR70_08220 [Rhodospirillaceae bacterium BRH_c57]|nr:MAG: hypothetical protein VR70_08220 [Rhodospirillaceae bacterium BRH_c57]
MTIQMTAVLKKNPGWEAGDGRWDEMPARYSAVKCGKSAIGWITLWPRYIELDGHRVAQLPYVSLKIADSRGGAMSRHIGEGIMHAGIEMDGYLLNVKIQKKSDGRRKAGYLFDVQIAMSEAAEVEQPAWMSTPGLNEIETSINQAEAFFSDD